MKWYDKVKEKVIGLYQLYKEHTDSKIAVIAIVAIIIIGVVMLSGGSFDLTSSYTSIGDIGSIGGDLTIGE